MIVGLSQKKPMIDQSYGPDKITVEEMLPTKRAANAASHFAYFTGKECVYGHASPRYASNGQCIECSKILPVPRPLVKKIRKMPTEEEKRKRRTAYYQANKERYRAYCRKYWEENKEELKQKNKEYREANKERCLEKDREKYLRNRERYIEKRKNYYYENREKQLGKRKEYRRNNKEEIRRRNREYYLKKKLEKANIDALNY